MITNDTATIAAKHNELRARRDEFAQKLQTALTAAGFAVTGKLSTEDWAASVLTAKSDKTSEFETYFRFEILSTSRWSRSTPDKVRLMVTYGGSYRSNKTRYQKLTDELVTTLVENTKGYLENILASIESRKEREQNETYWAGVRAEQLKGVVVPPGAEIKIVTGSGPGAGTYRIEFERHHNSITDIPMTPEQVRKLAALLNEIQGTANGYVLTAQHPRDNATIYYSHYSMWHHGDARIYPTQEAAEAAVEQAKRDLAPEVHNTIKAVPYASVATI